jgi:transcriptional regulator with XRE-family HTH domain
LEAFLQFSPFHVYEHMPNAMNLSSPFIATNICPTPMLGDMPNPLSAQILKGNLQKLMELHEHVQEDVAKLAKVDQSVISRILSPDGHRPRLDTVEAIALAYDLQAWALLLPGLDPRNPPVVTITESERELYWRLQQDLSKLVASGPSQESPGGISRPDRDPPGAERGPSRGRAKT